MSLTLSPLILNVFIIIVWAWSWYSFRHDITFNSRRVRHIFRNNSTNSWIGIFFFFVLFFMGFFPFLLVFLFYLSSVITRPSRQFPLASRAFVHFVQLIITETAAIRVAMLTSDPNPTYVAAQNVTETKKHAKNIKNMVRINYTYCSPFRHAKQEAVCWMTR